MEVGDDDNDPDDIVKVTDNEDYQKNSLITDFKAVIPMQHGSR